LRGTAIDARSVAWHTRVSKKIKFISQKFLDTKKPIEYFILKEDPTSIQFPTTILNHLEV
jgi:hypothetical protein